MTLPVYEVYAIRYAERDGRRPAHFVGGDPHDAPMPMDYFHIGGHPPGLQSVRVHAARGWLVLASDASHYYEHFETGRVFPVTVNLADVIEGYAKLQRLAQSMQHIVPGHDPLVMQRYPVAARGLAGIAVRLDAHPID